MINKLTVATRICHVPCDAIYLIIIVLYFVLLYERSTADFFIICTKKDLALFVMFKVVK